MAQAQEGAAGGLDAPDESTSGSAEEAPPAADEAPPPEVDAAATSEAEAFVPFDVPDEEEVEAPPEFEDVEMAPQRPPQPAVAQRPWSRTTVEPEQERYWRLPRSFVERPLTLPQGVARFSSPQSGTLVPGGSGAAFRVSTFFSFGVGLMDDWELGATPIGWTFPLSFQDPTVYTRVRLLSGEVQIALRGEVALPVSDQASAWINLAGELAWAPTSWFRFETGFDYGLHFVSPLQQTIYIPLRAVFQAGPNSFTLASGAVMYNDADDFDVPLLFRFAHSLRGGYQGPLMDVSIEAGVTDLTNAENSVLVRLNWTWFAYF